MAVTTKADTAEARLPTKEKFDRAKQLGEAHLKRLAPELRALGLGRGAYVIVNVTNGAYVTGENRSAALAKYREAFRDQMAWLCLIEDIA